LFENNTPVSSREHSRSPKWQEGQFPNPVEEIAVDENSIQLRFQQHYRIDDQQFPGFEDYRTDDSTGNFVEIEKTFTITNAQTSS
jgi:hypothetical protein